MLRFSKTLHSFSHTRLDMPVACSCTSREIIHFLYSFELHEAFGASFVQDSGTARVTNNRLSQFHYVSMTAVSTNVFLLRILYSIVVLVRAGWLWWHGFDASIRDILGIGVRYFVRQRAVNGAKRSV